MADARRKQIEKNRASKTATPTNDNATQSSKAATKTTLGKQYNNSSRSDTRNNTEPMANMANATTTLEVDRFVDFLNEELDCIPEDNETDSEDEEELTSHLYATTQYVSWTQLIYA